ncbi:MAG: serine/threonine protein kinase [Bradymonadales bacterium]|nr:serine/threonine protein kinase [Bradymonadales bacterium]
MHGQPQIQWAPGMRVGGRYVIRRILGQGGMGVVAIADDLLLRKPVALKALLPHLTSRAQSVELFFKEVAVAHAVTHPNIIRTYDLGEDHGIFFFTMEYLQGEALDDRLKRMGGKLPVQEVRELTLIICDALDAAHQAGVVHRDLKPSNIMLVNEPRQLVLLDFGISGFTGTSMEETAESPFTPRDSWVATSAGLGTPVYMPPEQWQKQPCGPPSDIYSLGVILFQALTGRAPFTGDNFMAFFNAHLHEPPPRLRDIDPKLPKDFDEAIAKCLVKDPSQRMQSAWQLAEALRPKRRFRRTLEVVVRALIIGLLLALIGYGVFRFAKGSLIVEMRPGLDSSLTV